jgi:YidC/Oxa1 family membrane protein insertase
MFTTIVIQPLYNALIFLVDFFPNHDLWIALVVLTVAFKTILIPLFKKQVRDQLVMQHLAPKLKALQEKLKDQKDVLAKETFALYSKYEVNPFVSILILIIQLPFLIGLYQIFYYDITTHKDLLYAAVTYPDYINNFFLGVNLSEKNLVFSILAAVSQYVLGVFMFKKKSPEEEANEAEMIKAMNVQMKYFLPIVIGVVSYITPSVIALYLIVTNLFGIGQEIIIKKPLERQIKKELQE